MPRIPSANPDFKQVPVPGYETGYIHPAERRKGTMGVPMAFQVTSPFDRRRVLMPHALVLHVNPSSLSETHNQKITRIQTRGGWVEQHWGPDLVELSADASTGAFMNIMTGASSVLRQRTIAWNRYRDLHDLYYNNGSLHDPTGAIVLQGHIMLMYDRGIFFGTFRSFEMTETDDSPFAFRLSWSFKIEETLTSIPFLTVPQVFAPAPEFQQANVPAKSNIAAGIENQT